MQLDLSSKLGEWCTEYLLNDVFFTDEDSNWLGENTSDEDSCSDSTIDSHAFEMTDIEWVNRYESSITSLFKEQNKLIDKIKNLRALYLESVNQPKFNRTGFLRNNIFWPKSPWLRVPYQFSAEAVRDLFNDKKFSDQTVSKAKNKKNGGK